MLATAGPLVDYLALLKREATFRILGSRLDLR